MCMYVLSMATTKLACVGFLRLLLLGSQYASVFVCVPVRACVSTCMPLDY